MRINRYLASCGLGSRRKVESLIEEGRVRVNGRLLLTPACQLKEGDRVAVDGREVLPLKKHYYLYNKPRFVLSSHADPHHQRFIYDDLPEGEGLVTAGRLDYESEGLMVITNDGGLIQALAHPSQGAGKTYFAYLDRPFQPADGAQLKEGVQSRGETYRIDRFQLDEGQKLYKALSLWLEDWPPEGNPQGRCLILCLHEGKKREIRRALQALGYGVERLVRIRIGEVSLKGLKAGHYRPLEEKEVEALWQTGRKKKE